MMGLSFFFVHHRSLALPIAVAYVWVNSGASFFALLIAVVDQCMSILLSRLRHSAPAELINVFHRASRYWNSRVGKSTGAHEGLSKACQTGFIVTAHSLARVTEALAHHVAGKVLCCGCTCAHPVHFCLWPHCPPDISAPHCVLNLACTGSLMRLPQVKLCI